MVLFSHLVVEFLQSSDNCSIVAHLQKMDAEQALRYIFAIQRTRSVNDFVENLVAVS